MDTLAQLAIVCVIIRIIPVVRHHTRTIRDHDPLTAVVLGPDKRHGRNDGVTELAAYVDGDGGALLVHTILDVRHRDVLPERRRGDAGRHDACEYISRSER